MEDYSSNDGSYSMKDEGNGGNGNVSEVKSNKSMVKKVIVGVVVVLIIYFF